MVNEGYEGYEGVRRKIMLEVLVLKSQNNNKTLSIRMGKNYFNEIFIYWHKILNLFKQIFLTVF